MSRIVDLAIDRPVATLMVLVSLIVLGGVALVRLPLDLMPAVKEPEIDVEADLPGAHPLEAMREIAAPIEEEIATVPGVRELESDAHADGATVTVHFDWSADMDVKQMEVREAVERARPRLPAAVENVRISVDVGGPAGGAVLQGRIAAERDLSESWELLDRHVRRPLEHIKGVARVDLYGVEPQQVRIEIDPQALQAHGIEPADLVARVDAANLDLDLGSIRGDVLRYTARSVGRFRDVGALQALQLATSGVRLGDVATVVVDEPSLDYGRHLDGKFALGIDVFKEASANTVDVVDHVMERIEDIRQDPELVGIRLLVWENAGEEIRGSIRGLRDAGVYGSLLAVVILWLFLRRVSTTAVVAAAIPFSLVVTCGAMYVLGSQFDVLTMLGLMLGVGMLVDNAVVVVENVHRHQHLGVAPRHAARVGAREVTLAVVASTATTLIVWSWLLILPKNEMAVYMGAVALTICLSVLASLLVSLTFIPLAAARLRPVPVGEDGLLHRRVLPAYRATLAWTLRHRAATLVALILLAASAALPISRIEKTGEPRMLQTSVSVFYQVYDRTSKEVMESYATEVERWLDGKREALGIENTYSWFSEGQGAMTRAYLPKGTPREAIERLREELKKDLPVIPGVTLDVGDRNWWQRREGDERVVNVALHGDDPEYLLILALMAEERLASVEDAVDVMGPSLAGQKELRLLVDGDRARSLGLTPEDVSRVVGGTFRERRLRRFRGEGREMEVVMRVPERLLYGVAALQALPIPVEHGTVPLSSVAELQVGRTPPWIHRSDRMTTQMVGVKFDRSVTTDEGKARVEKVMKSFELPPGYSWDWGRWGEEHDEALGVMLQGVLLSLVLVVLLMAACFESLLQPLAIVITLPLAFFGAFWALWALGYDLDVVAFMGVIILIGVVVNNGIVMVDHVNQLRAKGLSRDAALLQGCSDRFRPVLMTALTTLVGLVPLALSSATVAQVYIDSLAVAVIGGLTTSTIFTLLALPVWQSAIEDLGAFLVRLLPRRVLAAPSVATPDASLPPTFGVTE